MGTKRHLLGAKRHLLGTKRHLFLYIGFEFQTCIGSQFRFKKLNSDPIHNVLGLSLKYVLGYSSTSAFYVYY